MTGIPTDLVLRLMRSQLSGWHKGGVAEQRSRQLRSSRFFRVPGEVTCKGVAISGINAEWISCPEPEGPIILYLHGGAYALGSIDTHRELVARLVLASHSRALVINYRLAPENPFPAALEDTLTVYHWLLSESYHPSNLIFAGDSAGGGLAIAALLALRDNGEPLPAGAICFSPWFDLTLSGSTIQSNDKNDPILKGAILESYTRNYLGTAKAENPYISPLFADLHNLPPILLQSGEIEVLLDDSARFVEKARAADVDVSLRVWEGMFHVFQLIPFLPQSSDALRQAAGFIQRITEKSKPDKIVNKSN